MSAPPDTSAGDAPGAPEMAGIDRRWGDGAVVVVVAEEAPLARRQLVLALEAHPRVEVAAEVLDADQLVAAVTELGPHVVVVGMGLPPDGAGAALIAARHASPHLPAVVVTDPARASAGLALPGVATVALDTTPGELARTVVVLADTGHDR